MAAAKSAKDDLIMADSKEAVPKQEAKEPTPIDLKLKSSMDAVAGLCYFQSFSSLLIFCIALFRIFQKYGQTCPGLRKGSLRKSSVFWLVVYGTLSFFESVSILLSFVSLFKKVFLLTTLNVLFF